MDYFLLLALLLAVAFVLGLIYYNKKPELQQAASFTEAQLNEMAKKGKKKVKQPSVKLPASPVPVSNKKFKVEGALDHDNDDEVIKFLNNRITLDSKSKSSEPEGGETKAQKAPKQTADYAEGFLPTADRKKPKKENEGGSSPQKDENFRKNRPFYKDDKVEVEAKRSERDSRPRPPREPREPRNVAPRLQGAEGEIAGEGDEKRERPRPDRPKREFQPIIPAYQEPFEEMSIDSILDSITAAQAAPSRSKRTEDSDVSGALE